MEEGREGVEAVEGRGTDGGNWFCKSERERERERNLILTNIEQRKGWRNNFLSRVGGGERSGGTVGEWRGGESYLSEWRGGGNI